MKQTIAILVPALLLTISTALKSEVFRCENESGIIFSDQPCGENPETINIRDNRIGGSLDRNLPQPAQSQPENQAREEQEEENGTCRFINSTDLRRYIIREQVVAGMTRDNVRRAFGSPPETYTSPQEVWIYQTRYYGALYELTYVYFRDGCVERVEYRKP
ncbi:DUF4124 domain-containing protein [Marinobacter sediminum]|uniref:hypothetical protein n=1 Tax=Marinobacter sediminum TaxID=256323 RepID=UPI002030F81A|nr:hypothetical protein [Marinobacter sediminum]MCM0613576.1 DUF4124 domain-containing protein [Marinobacter sediminum]